LLTAPPACTPAQEERRFVKWRLEDDLAAYRQEPSSNPEHLYRVGELSDALRSPICQRFLELLPQAPVAERAFIYYEVSGANGVWDISSARSGVFSRNWKSADEFLLRRCGAPMRKAMRSNSLWRLRVARSVLLLAPCAIGILVAAPAAACGAAYAESYLLWYGLPDLLPGEVAIEIDVRDFAENHGGPDYSHPEYKVKRVIVGSFDGERIRVQPSYSTCAREAAAGFFRRLILVGRLGEGPGGEPLLIARYMPYDNPLRAEAERLYRERTPK
jgi:hypothetical protein